MPKFIGFSLKKIKYSYTQNYEILKNLITIFEEQKIIRFSLLFFISSFLSFSSLASSLLFYLCAIVTVHARHHHSKIRKKTIIVLSVCDGKRKRMRNEQNKQSKRSARHQVCKIQQFEMK